jgi:hypothetical protein
MPSSHGYIGIFLFRYLTPIPSRPHQLITNKIENKNNTVFGMTTPFTSKSDLLKQGNTSQLLLYLSADDFAKLILSLQLSSASKSSFLYLSMDGGIVRSSSGRHGNQAVPFDAPIPLSLETASNKEVGIGYAADTAPPYLVQFSLDLNIQSTALENSSYPVYGLLTMVFSEPIDIRVEQFQLSGLTLQNTKTLTASTKTFNLVDDSLKFNSTSGVVLPNNATVVGNSLYSHYYSFIKESDLLVLNKSRKDMSVVFLSLSLVCV